MNTVATMVDSDKCRPPSFPPSQKIRGKLNKKWLLIEENVLSLSPFYSLSSDNGAYRQILISYCGALWVLLVLRQPFNSRSDSEEFD